VEVRELLESRCARALDEDEHGRVLVASDLTGTLQLYELEGGRDGGALRPLTDLAEPVSGRYLSGTRRAVVQMDAGGDERHQLYLIELDEPPLRDAAAMTPLTADPAHVHALIGVRGDGGEIALTSNRRNGVDFDVEVLDLATLERRTVYDGGGWTQPASGYSPSGRWLSFLVPGDAPLDHELCLADRVTGEIVRPLAHPDEAAHVGGPCWIGEHTFIVASNVGRDLAALVAHDLGRHTSETVLEADHDLDCFVSADGRALLVVANAGGASQAALHEPRIVEGAVSLAALGPLALPARGVIAGSLMTPAPRVGAGGAHVTFTFSSPCHPGDVWRAARGQARPWRLTASPGPDPAALAVPTTESVASFDGEPVPLFAFRPAAPAERPPPVVLVVHGGPESQALLTFNPIVQGLVARGFAVLVPNVRGSVGYGRRYAGLDDTVRRLDSVADLAAIHEWLPSAGLDPRRAALFGGSYGGYMVLAGVAFQPERWAAGVDIVGISDLVTFLENTSGYRRAHREREYGSLREDRAFLERASPLRRADEIRAPLFIIHGANDPRVPVSEARQLAASLERRGVDHELVVYEDEGHGLAKLRNRLDAYPRAVEFLAARLGLA